MNTFYFNEKTEYIELEQPKNDKFIKIETEKSFEGFEDMYFAYRQQGESILDSIEWAK